MDEQDRRARLRRRPITRAVGRMLLAICCLALISAPVAGAATSSKAKAKTHHAKKKKAKKKAAKRAGDAPGLAISLTPANDSGVVGTTHTVVAHVSGDRGAAVAGQNVGFGVTAGPNAGVRFVGTTNRAGNARFTYTGNGGEGTDTIVAGVSDGRTFSSDTAHMRWYRRTEPVPPDPPTVSIVSPVDGATYSLNQVVIAQFSCAEGARGPGLVECSGDVDNGSAVDTSTVGTHTFRARARSGDGLTTERTVTYTVVRGGEIGQPSITIVTPADGGIYTVGDQVPASFFCTPGANSEGIRSCDGTVRNGQNIDTATPGTKTFTVNLVSKENQTATKTVTYTVRARPAAPVVTIVSPQNGATYTLGQIVPASYSCAPGINGAAITSCVGTVANGAPADTATPGLKQFTVVATAADGQQTTGVAYYAVGRVATVLRAQPEILSVLGTPPLLVRVAVVDATLTTSTGQPIAGRTVTFRAGSTPLCSATTDPTGRATCQYDIGGLLSSVLSLGYEADFAGDAMFAPSTVHAPLANVLGIGLA